MQFSKSKADVFVPGGGDPVEALRRTTHLCLAAHQDDIEIFALHGIGECFQRADRSFTGVVLTNGAGSPRSGPYASFSDAQMQAVRREEQRTAAEAGKYGLQLQLGYSSSEVKDYANREISADLRLILAEARPEVVYLHNPFDKHDTHLGVLLHALTALRSLPAEQRPRSVLGGEVWRGLDWVLDRDKVALPMTLHESLATTLLGIFDSQVGGGKRYDLATRGRRIANATYAQSHATDAAGMLDWSVDLTPLVREDGPSLEAYVQGVLDRFRDDILGRIARVSAS